MPDVRIRRARLPELDRAFRIVTEYYEAACVVHRDSREEFHKLYFPKGAGVWLAFLGRRTAGVIALRRLPQVPGAGEVKRLFVRPAHRGQGLAAGLLEALEAYARRSGYRWLYLDTTDEMVRAARFYRSHGYRACARYNDNSQATIFLRKKL